MIAVRKWQRGAQVIKKKAVVIDGVGAGARAARNGARPAADDGVPTRVERAFYACKAGCMFVGVSRRWHCVVW